LDNGSHVAGQPRLVTHGKVVVTGWLGQNDMRKKSIGRTAMMTRKLWEDSHGRTVLSLRELQLQENTEIW
jgi:hypothetical protein